MGVRVTIGSQVYTEKEAIKKGLISKREVELLGKAVSIIKGNLRTSKKRSVKNNSHKRR